MAPHAEFPPPKVLALASALRSDGKSATFCFDTDENPIFVGQCLIYAVKFPDDDETWAIRIPLHEDGTLPPSAITSMVETEMDVLTELSKTGFRWSPRLIGGDSSFDNPIEHPYLVLSWVRGNPLQWTPAIPAEPEQRHKILCQLTDIQLDLAQCTQRSRPETSVVQYLTDIIDGKIGRVSNGRLPELDIQSCFVHRELARYAVHDELESSLFAISHGSLGAHKIIVDNEYNITGIIDWKLARFRPLQLVLRFPRLLAVEPDNMDLPSSQTDIANLAAEALHPSSRISADRRVVVSYLSSLASDEVSSKPPQIASLASTMNAIVTDKNVDWQDLVIRSCFSKGLHKWMVEQSWLLNGTQGIVTRTSSDKTISEETEEFLRVIGTKETSLKQDS